MLAHRYFLILAGYVNECLKNKIQVVPIPGVSSIISAISISGFKDQFLFYGFLPKTENELEKVLATLSENIFTQVFFAAPNKINLYIKYFKKFYNDRKILIAKEITKLHEAFYREDVKEVVKFKKPLKGELTIVISEKNLKVKNFDEEKIVSKIKKYLKKYSLRDTVNLILETEKINKKTVYDLCLKIKNEKNSYFFNNFIFFILFFTY